jgi:hypothetical protein
MLCTGPPIELFLQLGFYYSQRFRAAHRNYPRPVRTKSVLSFRQLLSSPGEHTYEPGFPY